MNQPPRFESPEQKKRKKPEADEKQSRFERIQEALRRAMESLLESPKTEEGGAASRREKESHRAETTEKPEHETEEVGRVKQQPERPVTPVRPATVERSSASREHPPISRTKETGQQPSTVTFEGAGHETLDEDELTDSRSAALRERADQLWQQTREAVRSFIDKSKAVVGSESDVTSLATEAPSNQLLEASGSSDQTGESAQQPEAVDGPIDQQSGDHEAASLSGLTIAELEERFGKRPNAEQRRPTERTSEAASSAVVPLYVAFNELRQRRYKKKLEKIAQTQRQQQRTINQTERNLAEERAADRAQKPATTQPGRTLRLERPETSSTVAREPVDAADKRQLPRRQPERQASQMSVPEQQPEVREGEVRVDYPPAVAPIRTEQMQPRLDSTPQLDQETDRSDEGEPKDAAQRSQPPVALRELVERHPAAQREQRTGSPEALQLSPSPERRVAEGSQPANTASVAPKSGAGGTQAAQVTASTPQASTKPSSQDVDMPTRQDIVGSSGKIAPTPQWQRVLLVVINLVLIALLVRELVF